MTEKDYTLFQKMVEGARIEEMIQNLNREQDNSLDMIEVRLPVEKELIDEMIEELKEMVEDDE